MFCRQESETESAKLSTTPKADSTESPPRAQTPRLCNLETMPTPKFKIQNGKFALFFVLLFGLLAAAQGRPAPPQNRFDLPAPTHLARPISLWATWYWTPAYRDIPNGISLRDDDDKPLGPRLEQEDFCSAAVECSVLVKGKLYIYSSLGKTAQTDCSRHWAHMKHAPYVRFQRSKACYGEGSADYQLVPYRTLAVDTARIPIGAVLFIPKARGAKITLPNGATALHDGYFFAGDEGFGIEKNHIDVFIGVTKENPFDFVTSDSQGKFAAYRVTDPAILKRFRILHRHPAA